MGLPFKDAYILFMKSAGFCFYVFTIVISLHVGCVDPSLSTSNPNIIVFLIDDAGYADFGFMGCEDLATPNIDRLAEGGMIFTDAHVSASVCAPSRAGLLTGRYQQRFGFECNALAHFQGIDTSELTIAEVMKQGGYNTAAFGKWHVGDAPESRPNARGFDYFYGFLSGARSYFPNDREDREGHLKSIRLNDTFTTFNGYLTDVLATEAIKYIEQKKEEQFFIYWSPNAVHTPMEATAEDLEKYTGHPRQKLAAMTWALDRAIGNIVNKLEQVGLLDNTLIFFLSDNGGATTNQSSNRPLKGFKGNKYEGGHRIPFFIHWPNQVKPNQYFEGLTSSLDIFTTCVDLVNLELPNVELDGVSLLPYIQGKSSESPHSEMYWRKEGMAAARYNDYKLIRVDSLGSRLYDLSEDLSESQDLQQFNHDIFQIMNQKLESWEKQMIGPKWIESEVWNKVTWYIHQDLFENRKVRITSPQELERIKNTIK